jgi:hypothetical protein
MELRRKSPVEIGLKIRFGEEKTEVSVYELIYEKLLS